MKVERHALFWGLALVVVVAALLLLQEVLLPFVLGLAIAYLLDPVADVIERIGVNRLTATVIILVLFLLALVAVVLFVVPLLIDQLAAFAKEVPGYVAQLKTFLADPARDWLRRNFGAQIDSMQESLGQVLGQGATWAAALLTQVWAGGQAFLGVLSVILITPVVAFYMLVDWDAMIAKIDSWLPRDHRQTIRGIFAEIDQVMSGFVRGQATVCLILGVGYALALSLVGLNFGVLIGLVSGIISFIPFVGAIVGAVASVGVALFQFWPDWLMIGAVAAIFVVGQAIEGNFLTPRFVGRSVGLHPVVVLFALLAFGALFGFLGVLLAVPLAAVVGVLARFALHSYLQSPIYRGRLPMAPPPTVQMPSGATLPDAPPQIETGKPVNGIPPAVAP